MPIRLLLSLTVAAVYIISVGKENKLFYVTILFKFCQFLFMWKRVELYPANFQVRSLVEEIIDDFVAQYVPSAYGHGERDIIQ